MEDVIVVEERALPAGEPAEAGGILPPPAVSGGDDLSPAGGQAVGAFGHAPIPAEFPEPATSPNALIDTLMLGGFVVWLLIAMSVLALAVVLLKLWQFGQAGVGRRRAAAEMVALHRQGLSSKALALAPEARGLLAGLVALAIAGQARGLSEAKIREEVLRQGRDVLEELRSGFRVLEVIATLAPLLGLFGTVLGMIEAFRELEAAGNQVNPAILSGGIWQALLTTAVGLAVAMPTVALLNWLERRVERLAHAMDNHITQVFTEDLNEMGGQAGARETRHGLISLEPTASG